MKEKNTKMVQRRVQGNFILFLLSNRKSIKKNKKKQREYIDANKLANARRDVLHKN